MPQRDRPAQTDDERVRALARLKEAVSSRSRPRDEPKPRKTKRRKSPVAASRNADDKPPR